VIGRPAMVNSTPKLVIVNWVYGGGKTENRNQTGPETLVRAGESGNTILKRGRNLIKASRSTSLILAVLLATLSPVTSANAQSSQNSRFAVGSIDHGLVVGVLVGVVAVAGVAVTYFVVHNRGIASGCISESGGKRTLVASDNTVYSLPDTGSSLPVGKRVKLKGHKLGPASSRSFQVEKVLKVYGPCQHEPR
jgi:hypothetical protein